MQTQEVIQLVVQEPQETEALTIHLSRSVRAQVEAICAKQDITLNHFVNVAIADRIAHDSNLEWVQNRKVPTPESIEEVRKILRRPSTRPPDPGDELPEGW